MVANVGDVLAGKYRVDKVLGIGGMGMVVAATHLELDQKVALKFMLPAALASEEATERFLREARAAVRLRGEHVCRVLDVGKLAGGEPYIVMEYLAGHDFAATLKEYGPLATDDAVDYLLQAIEGVAEAHANNIVHRDLKPANLFVTTDNDGSPLVKVLDFGISKSELGGVHQTKTGDIMGSPAYMAPEQMASSKDVDARADQWALGVILYQALCNKVPFQGDTLPVLCVQVMTEAPPPLGQVRPDLPAELSAAVMRCLEKKRDARFADVGELAAVIARFGSDEAAAAARRIAKVLRRPMPVATPTVDPGSSGMAPTLMATADAFAPPAPRRATIATAADQSSISSAAGELGIPVPPRRKTAVFVGIAGVAIAAIAIGVVVFTGGGGKSPEPRAAPVAASPPAITPPAARPDAGAPVAEVQATTPAVTAPTTMTTAVTKPVVAKPVGPRRPPGKVDTVSDHAAEQKAAEQKAAEQKAAEQKAGGCHQKSDCAADQACGAGACKKVDLTKTLIED